MHFITGKNISDIQQRMPLVHENEGYLIQGWKTVYVERQRDAVSQY